MNTPVKHPLAKLLKEKGFDEYTDRVYLSENNIKLQRGLVNYPKILYPNAITAPTIGQVVMWLYEKHGIWIGVDFKETDESFQYCCRLVNSNKLPRIFCNDGFNSPTEAYEAAIEYCLNNLI